MRHADTVPRPYDAPMAEVVLTEPGACGTHVLIVGDPERAALQLLDVIEGLKVPDSGKLFDFQGEEIPF